MKRIVMMSIIITALQGSQKNAYTCGQSKIILCSGDSVGISKIAQQCGYIVVGSNEQRILINKIQNKKTSLMPSEQKSIGTIEYPCSAVVRDNSVDDSHIPFTVNKVKDFEKIVSLDLPQCTDILRVEEPILHWRSKEGIDSKETYCYLLGNNHNAEKRWGKEALASVHKDLAFSYEKVLHALSEKSGKGRVIAFTALSADTGVPIAIVAEVAIKTIRDFLKNNEHQQPFYIYLLAKNERIFTAYQSYIEALKDNQ